MRARELSDLLKVIKQIAYQRKCPIDFKGLMMTDPQLSERVIDQRTDQ